MKKKDKRRSAPTKPSGVSRRKFIQAVGLAGAAATLPLTQACGSLMCGFCTPGFIVSGVSCLEKNPNASRDEIRRALDGNICRCGTQVRALEACEKAARRMKGRR